MEPCGWLVCMQDLVKGIWQEHIRALVVIYESLLDIIDNPMLSN